MIVRIFGVLYISFFACQALASNLSGIWVSQDGSHQAELHDFQMNGKNLVTVNTQSFYGNGAGVDWFFEFNLPAEGDVLPGQVLTGRVRSIDSLYACVFDEPAQAILDETNQLRLQFSLMVYTRRTTSIAEDGGYVYRRRISWQGWDWVEKIYYYPIKNWQVISSECIIKDRVPVTTRLSR